jgi:hypothetical protein
MAVLLSACASDVDSLSTNQAVDGGLQGNPNLNPGPSPLRRLTPLQYNNIVRDILGDTTNPANQFPADPRKEGFNNFAETLIVSEAHAEAYSNAAVSVADRAISTNLAKILGCEPARDGEDACAKTFIADMGKKYFGALLIVVKIQNSLTSLRTVQALY